MAKWESEETVTLSVLERLIDRDPAGGPETPMSRAQSVRQLKGSLRRDLEWLLNTRRIPEPAPESFQELHRSVYNYGFPDVTSLSHDSEGDRARLLEMLESTIARFEPRLDRVKVTPLPAASGSLHVLRFQIEGMLLMDPAPEHISFDTVLRLSSGEYQVKGEAGAG